MFASSCLCRSSTLKKITFLPSKLLDFGRTHFSAFIASLRDNVPVNLKLVRYMPLDPQGDVEVYYHRETPVHGEWWLCLPPNEGEEKFAEGRTPRIVPVGKWDWETEAERNL